METELVVFDAFLAGYASARHIHCVADIADPKDYHRAHIEAQNYAKAAIAAIDESRSVSDLTYLEAEARRFAEFYPEASDGRNTFVIFADKIASLRPPYRGVE